MSITPPPPAHGSTTPVPRRAAPPPPPADRTLFLQGVIVGSLCTAIAAALVVLVLWRPEPAPIAIHPPPTAAPAATATPVALTVHIAGAVRKPGVYALLASARVGDAIDAAGGLSPEADLAQLNLALPVVDGQKLQVARVGEIVTPMALPAAGRSGAPIAGTINLNTASIEDLMTLPGVGETKAQAIVEGRPYSSVDDLDRISGFGEKTIEQLRGMVSAP